MSVYSTDNNGNARMVANVGGGSGGVIVGSPCGAFCTYLADTASVAASTVGGSLVYKGIAGGNS